jgi:hypothetical protein
MDHYSCTTQVPNALFDQWMAELSLSELKLLLLVTRMTRGWIVRATGKRKVRDWLSCSRIMAQTGLSDRAITTATSSLVAKGLLVVTDVHGHDLSDARNRQGCMRLFYGLAVDSRSDPNCLRRTSETVAEVDPKNLRTTKPTFTKPTLQKSANALAGNGQTMRPHYAGHIADALQRFVPASILERVHVDLTAPSSFREKSP